MRKQEKKLDLLNKQGNIKFYVAKNPEKRDPENKWVNQERLKNYIYIHRWTPTVRKE